MSNWQSSSAVLHAAAYATLSLPPISALVLNAAIQSVTLDTTADSYELNLGVNQLGNALVLFLLAPPLAPAARVVVVGLSAHDPALKRIAVPPVYVSGAAAAHLPATARASINEAMTRYALSKLCQTLWAYALARHAAAAARPACTVNTLDPGVMPTKLYRWAPAPLAWLTRAVFSSRLGQCWISDTHGTDVAAASLAALATDGKFAGVSGKYFQVTEAEEGMSSEQSHDEAAQEELWEWTLRALAKDDAEMAQFARLGA